MPDLEKQKVTDYLPFLSAQMMSRTLRKASITPSPTAAASYKTPCSLLVCDISWLTNPYYAASILQRCGLGMKWPSDADEWC